MPIIAPFRGLTYNYKAHPDISSLVAPPYDVISQDEQDEFHRADPHNVIRLILGVKKAGDSDWDNRYTRAAENFKRWESEGILVRADRPCIYITSLTYDPGTGEGLRTRWGLIALVRIEDPDSGVILPHIFSCSNSEITVEVINEGIASFEIRLITLSINDFSFSKKDVSNETLRSGTFSVIPNHNSFLVYS